MLSDEVVAARLRLSIPVGVPFAWLSIWLKTPWLSQESLNMGHDSLRFRCTHTKTHRD
jgi:hypothetical protein